MTTQPTPGPVFTETQWFFRRWWWLMPGAAVALIAPLVAAIHRPHGVQALLTAAPLVLLVLAGLYSLKLTVRVDALGVHYQYTPLLNRWRHWPWNEFKQVFPRTYSPLGDYGGWGIRGLPGNLVYNVWGKTGLQLIFKSGNRLLLGTQQPQELQQVLAALQAAAPTGPIFLANTCY